MSAGGTHTTTGEDENDKSDLDSQAVAAGIRRDVSDGDAAGVDGTPTIFLNGEKLSGNLSTPR